MDLENFSQLSILSHRRPDSASDGRTKRTDSFAVGTCAPISTDLRQAYTTLTNIHRPQRASQRFPPVADTGIDEYLRQLTQEFNLGAQANDLRLLRHFEIVILCDDSGSMNTTVDQTKRTRWDELRDIVKIILQISTIFDRNGVDVYFLNRPPVLKVTDPDAIDESFKEDPHDYSNLATALDYIFGLEVAQSGNDKKLLVFVATDAEPTNDRNLKDLSSLETVMRKKRRPDTTHVMFLLCNDNPKCVEFLSKWDRDMENVDVLDDYRTERDRVRRTRGDTHAFGYGEYILKALLGAVDRKWDALGETDD